ncbi:cysteine desulfurase NifS, partial [Patescibacteria group bacterium]|nr:cysteine desulfurase NifS [Patescibacteria group bacterium]
MPEVAREVARYLTVQFGNPSSVHSWGRKVKVAVNRARIEVADFFG